MRKNHKGNSDLPKGILRNAENNWFMLLFVLLKEVTKKLDGGIPKGIAKRFSGEIA